MANSTILSLGKVRISKKEVEVKFIRLNMDYIQKKGGENYEQKQKKTYVEATNLSSQKDQKK